MLSSYFDLSSWFLQGPAARLYNWNTLVPVLSEFGIDIDADTKALVVARDPDILVQVLEELYTVNLLTHSLL